MTSFFKLAVLPQPHRRPTNWRFPAKARMERKKVRCRWKPLSGKCALPAEGGRRKNDAGNALTSRTRTLSCYLRPHSCSQVCLLSQAVNKSAYRTKLIARRFPRSR